MTRRVFSFITNLAPCSAWVTAFVNSQEDTPFVRLSLVFLRKNKHAYHTSDVYWTNTQIIILWLAAIVDKESVFMATLNPRQQVDSLRVEEYFYFIQNFPASRLLEICEVNLVSNNFNH